MGGNERYCPLPVCTLLISVTYSTDTDVKTGMICHDMTVHWSFSGLFLPSAVRVLL